MKVEVAYATVKAQTLLTVEVAESASVADAVVASGVLERHVEIAWPDVPLGIFGQRCAADTALRPGDRVEIYRPLVIDPKQARRERAEKRRAAGEKF